MDAQQRIKFIRDYLRLSQAKFAESIDVTQSRIGSIENGVTANISPKLASKITQKYQNINYVWLLTGEGEPFLSIKEKPDSSKQISNSNYSQSIKNDLQFLGTVATIVKVQLPFICGDLSMGLESALLNAQVFTTDKDLAQGIDFVYGYQGVTYIGAKVFSGDFLYCKKPSLLDFSKRRPCVVNFEGSTMLGIVSYQNNILVAEFLNEDGQKLIKNEITQHPVSFSDIMGVVIRSTTDCNLE